LEKVVLLREDITIVVIADMIVTAIPKATRASTMV
jgi:hypothetical protein